jgi:hypothetical protein
MPRLVRLTVRQDTGQFNNSPFRGLGSRYKGTPERLEWVG